MIESGQLSPERQSRRLKMAESSAAGLRGEVRLRKADGAERRYWEWLNPEVLALIFTRIPTDELARTVPFVCRGWWEALLEPYCCPEIDIVKWCYRVNRPDVIDAAVRKLVRRSRYTLRRLSAFRIENWGFSLTASFGTHLKVMEIPMSDVNDTSIGKYSGTLTALEVLDISHCNNITSKGIAILGKNCTSLINLRRNMYTSEFESTQDNGVAVKIDEAEALAVSNTMLGLEHLELAFGRFSDHGLDAILSNCKALSYLDVRGCCNVKLAGSVGTKCHALKFFRDPSYDQQYGFYLSCSGESDDGDDDSDVESE